MTKDHEQFAKVLALAINPGAVEGEAVAALRRLRELVKRNPTLGHAPSHPSPPSSPPRPASQPLSTLNVRVSTVHPDWLLILVSLLSRTAYQLALKYQIDFDFSETPTAVTVVCEGTDAACTSMSETVTWAVNYINAQLAKGRS
jgi:hypothetical protein